MFIKTMIIDKILELKIQKKNIIEEMIETKKCNYNWVKLITITGIKGLLHGLLTTSSSEGGITEELWESAETF